MAGITLSLIVGFFLACSTVWLISRINDRHTERERDLSRVLAKRGKKEGFFMGILAADRGGKAVEEPRKRRSRVRYEIKRIAGREHPLAGGGTRI